MNFEKYEEIAYRAMHDFEEKAWEYSVVTDNNSADTYSVFKFLDGSISEYNESDIECLKIVSAFWSLVGELKASYKDCDSPSLVISEVDAICTMLMSEGLKMAETIEEGLRWPLSQK